MFIKNCQFSLLIFLLSVSFTKCFHFLAGSFTYKYIQQIIDYNISKSILVQIHFYVSNDFFLCTSEHNNTIDIKCFSEKSNKACQNFKQPVWVFCEHTNKKSGYSILKREFLLIVERYKPLNVYYVCKFKLK